MLTYLTDLPASVTLKIFLELDLPTLISCSAVCKKWNNVAQDRTIWAQFALKIVDLNTYNASKTLSLKQRMIKVIEFSLKCSKKKNKATAVYHHVMLSRLNLSNLETALDCAHQINEKEKARKSGLYYLIGQEFLQKQQFNQTLESLSLMEKTTTQSQLAFKIFKKTLQVNQFSCAQTALKYINSEKGKFNRALSLLVWKLEQHAQYNTLLKLFKEYSHYAIIDACIRRVHYCLTETDENKALRLYKLYPDCFVNYTIMDVKFYIYNGQFAYAEKIALFNEERDPAASVSYLTVLQKAHQNHSSESEINRIKLLKKRILHTIFNN